VIRGVEDLGEGDVSPRQLEIWKTCERLWTSEEKFPRDAERLLLDRRSTRRLLSDDRVHTLQSLIYIMIWQR
jgi:hypothetical protein